MRREIERGGGIRKSFGGGSDGDKMGPRVVVVNNVKMSVLSQASGGTQYSIVYIALAV